MKKYLISIIVALIFSTSCNKFDEINKDPNKPSEVSASLLASKMIMDMTRKSGGDKNFIWDQMLAKYMSWTEGSDDNIFNKIATAGANFQEIPTGVSMVDYAHELDKEAYQGLAIVVKVYWIFRSSMQLGDVPYKEAGKAKEGVIRPKYDPQKEVMIGLLDELDQAYTHFSKATRSFDGDPVLNGDITKWKKVVTAMQLKILINLSKKVDDAEVKVKQRFAEIYANKSLMQSNEDNLQLVYADKGGIYYPYSRVNTQQADGPMLSTVLIDTLKKYKDYRLFYYAEPCEALDGVKPSDSWDAYVGVDISKKYSEQSDQNAKNMICKINKRYTENNAGEPVIKLGYVEQQFILAEAALRGWIAGNPSDFYKKGIKGAMEFIVKATPSGKNYEHGRIMTNDYIEDYLENNQEIQLTGNFEYNLGKIITQKYLSGFLQYQWDPYFDYRRTGYPKFPINPESSLNDLGFKDQLPVRWRYSQDQYNSNRENLVEALERQFEKGQDSNNSRMWLLKD